MSSLRLAVLAAFLVVPAPLAAQTALHETIEQVLPKMVKIFGAGGFRGLHAYSTGFLVSAQTKLEARRGVHQVPYKGSVFVVDAIVNNPGAGGGVVTTRDGKLLGMIGKELRDAGTNTWINYSIPISELKEPMAAIVAGRYISQRTPTEEEENPRRYSPIDFGLVMVPDVLYRTPAYLDSVVTGSPAARAGLRRDDLALFANDQLVQSLRHLNEILGRLKPGDTLRLVVRRGQSLVTVEMPVEAKPEESP